MEEVISKMKHLKTLDEELLEFVKELADMKTSKVHKTMKTFVCKLAASYGKLTSDELKLVDEEMKGAIGVTTKEIENLEDRSWDNVVACMMQNPVLERIDDSNKTNSNFFPNNNFNIFKFDGSPDPEVVMHVRSWFDELIKDSDILKDTNIDIDVMAKIVAQTGATVTGPLTLLHKKEFEEKDLIDVDILRYPDRESPVFKLYRIRLKVWSGCVRVLMVQRDRNGIKGEFKQMKFKPRKCVIGSLPMETRETDIEEGEDASLSSYSAEPEGTEALFF